MSGERMDVVNIDSENSDEDKILENKVKSVTLVDRSRLAKKSTAPAPVPEIKYQLLTKRQAAIASKDKTKEIVKQISDKEYFETESRRKNEKRNVRRIPGALYDSSGVHINSNVDLCDCLQDSCRGCHFHCRKCASQKCGAECRVNRKFVYENIEYHGYEFVIKNPLL